MDNYPMRVCRIRTMQRVHAHVAVGATSSSHAFFYFFVASSTSSVFFFAVYLTALVFLRLAPSPTRHSQEMPSLLHRRERHIQS